MKSIIARVKEPSYSVQTKEGQFEVRTYEPRVVAETDPRVVLRELPASRFAVVRFSGRWRDEKMRDRTQALRAWAKRRGLTVAGEPEVNRYDPPWTPWFFRRNEEWLAA